MAWKSSSGSVDAQRRGGREQRAEARPLAEGLATAGEQLHHLDQRLGSRGAVDQGHVLARLSEHRVVADQLADLDGHVVGRDRRPHEVHLGHLVEQRRRRLQVGERRVPALAGLVIEDEGGTAGRAEAGGLAVGKEHVERRLHAGHDEAPRTARHGRAHELVRQPRDAGGDVDDGALRRQQRQGARVAQLDADALQHVERSDDDRLLLRLVEPAHPGTHVESSDRQTAMGGEPSPGSPPGSPTR